MILRKKKRIKELEKENKKLRENIIEQEKTICYQRARMTFQRMNGSN